MTDSQFEAPRQDLRAMRINFEQRFDCVSQRFDGVDQRFTGVESRLTKTKVQLDSKPDKAFVYQTLFTILAILMFRSFLVPV